MERKDILAVIDRYGEYFRLWDAGIAEGIIGGNIFYVKNNNGEVETLMTFETGKQLENIILGTLAENMTCMLESIPDSLSLRFRNLEMKAARDHHDVTDYLPLLIEELSLIREEFREWQEMLGMTLKPAISLIDAYSAAKQDPGPTEKV